MTPASRTRHRRAARRNERGIALALALFTLATLLLTAATAFVVGSADLRATRNYRGASQVHFVAESGITHAVQVVNGIGTVDLGNEIINEWGTVYGNGTKTYTGIAGYTYQVVAFADAADPVNFARFVSSANGPDGTRNVVVARIERENIPNTAPGAVYLSQDSQTSATFQGNMFQVDGNDHDYTGGAGPKPPIPGISTRNAANTTEAIASLSSGQLDNVTGLGFLAGPPTVPSIQTSGWAPSVDQVNEIAASLLSRPGVVDYAGGNITGNAEFGTTASPQITHFTANTTLKGTGNASGAGIMIVDGDLTIQGTFDFKGLIIVRGKTTVTQDPETTITGNATLYGSLWTNDVNLSIGGSAIVNYSSQALALANLVNGGEALPAPIKVVALADCAQAPSVPGC